MGKAAGGNTKASKAGQPKRKRYIASRRGYRRRLRELERHVKRNPKDKQAEGALPRVRQLAIG